MKKIICCFLSVVFCFLSLTVVKAESLTYVLLTANQPFIGAQSSSRRWAIITSTSTKFVLVGGEWSLHWMAVSTQPFMYGTNANYTPDSTISASNNSLSYTLNNTTYYYCEVMMNTGSVTFNAPLYPIENNNSVETAIYYTYGEGAVDPAPPAPEYSGLANVGYNTKIAGSGQAAINNLDTVSWNPETDTAGNDISDMSVSIRVVPGKYSASSRQSLAEKLYSDFVLNTLDATVLDTVHVSSGSFSVTWEDVIDELALPFATISSIVDQDGTFIKNGWIYQVRLEGDGYEGQWQTVYTATSSGVQNDLTIIKSTTINQTLVNTITEINQLNSTSNNWYINETTINMSDYTEPSQGEKPWWAYLLEAIVSLINKIVDGIASIVRAIADLVGDIIDGILGLFTFDSFSVPDFSTNQQNIHDNSGIFGESIDILQTMNQTISNADSSAEPILYYPGIDLEGVEFIPEITINLNDYVEDLGLTQWHNLAYTCTDIFIWTTLIYTIYRKVIGVFKK